MGLTTIPRLDHSPESEQIRDCYITSESIVFETSELLKMSMQNIQASRVLGSGRIVILRDGVSPAQDHPRHINECLSIFKEILPLSSNRTSCVII